MFSDLQNSPDPFYCPHCQLKNRATIISELKTTIASLNETITALKTSVKSLEPTSEPVIVSNSLSTGNINSKPTHIIPSNKPLISATRFEDKKFNIVMYGIKESPPKTSKSDCLENDLQSINNAFTNADLQIQANSIKDCFHLGKYKSDASHPRLILIKFLRSTEAIMALSKITSFQAPVRIKPDLSPEERKAESILLKERWSLMQSGFDKKRIKIRNKSIYVDSKLYGQFHNSEFCRSQYNPSLNSDRPSDVTSLSQATFTNQPSSSTTTKANK